MTEYEEAEELERLTRPMSAGYIISSQDSVNHPSHYTFGKFEVIDVLEDWFPDDPLLWQVGKYISRAGHKNNLVEDLKKARWYLDRRIAKEEGKNA
jgi:hypothetical protein